MKLISIALCCLCLTGTSLAQTPEDLVFQNTGQELTPREEKLLAAIAANRPGTAGPSQPVLMPDSTFVITYGSQQDHTIFCAPRHVCDVALEPGESVGTMHVGDEPKWKITAAISKTRVGDVDLEVQHILIKPADYGLSTDLVVTTGRRTYHLILRSEKRRLDAETGQPLPDRYMASVAFKYANDLNKSWATDVQRARRNLHASPAQTAQAVRRPARDRGPRGSRPSGRSGVDMTKLSFNYEIVGDSPLITPTRVANDGNKTYIYMPPEMRNAQLPVLHEVRDHGGLFTAEDRVLINSDLINGVYVVDFVFDEVVMVAGVGGNQKTVRIIRK